MSKKLEGIMKLVVDLKGGKIKKSELPQGVVKRVTQLAADMTPEEFASYSAPAPTPPPKGRRIYIRNVLSS
jgi:hypothetical protein